MREYREYLVKAKHKAQEDFDKTLIALSGGALGFSLTFISDIVGDQPENLSMLGIAWGAWCLSLVFVLISFASSAASYIRAIKQVDSDTIQSETPGGVYPKITDCLNALGAIAFLVGLFSMVYFSFVNLGG